MSRLTPEQVNIVRHPGGPALVKATPGAGKTTCLLAFIYELQKKAVQPERILAVTFTRAAISQMRPRLAKRTGNEWAERVDFRTIHSFAYHILRLANIPLENVISDPGTILRPIMQEVGLRNTDQVAVEGMATDISRYKNLGSPKTFVPGSVSPYFFKQVLRMYEETKLVDRVMDMDDLIERAVGYLQDTPTARRYWQDQYDWVLIDEHQDTSPLQWALMKSILPEYKPNLICVGDDDQAIYGWRGSTPDALLNFQREYPGAPIYPLTVSHRCPPPILEPAARLIEHNRRRLAKRIVSTKRGGEAPRLIRPKDAWDELKQVVELLSEAHKSGKNLNDYAVLYRASVQAVPFLRMAEQAGIPFRVLGGLKNPFTRWMIRDVMSYIRIAWGSGDRGDFERITRRPRRHGLYEESVWQLFADGLARTGSSLEALKHIEFNGGPAARVEAKELLVLCQELRETPAADAMEFILDRFRYREGIYQYCSFSGSDMEEALEQVRSLSMLVPPDFPTSELITLADEAGTQTQALRGGGTGVTFATVHAAKGLEWAHVIIIGAVANNYPLQKSNEQPDFEEERRLFYVAMTRAKQTLMISSPRRWPTAMDIEPSPFLVEAGLLGETHRGSKPKRKHYRLRLAGS